MALRLTVEKKPWHPGVAQKRPGFILTNPMVGLAHHRASQPSKWVEMMSFLFLSSRHLHAILKQDGLLKACILFSQDRWHHKGTFFFPLSSPMFKFLTIKWPVLVDLFHLTCMAVANGFQWPTESPLCFYMKPTSNPIWLHWRPIQHLGKLSCLQTYCWMKFSSSFCQLGYTGGLL